jgi:hypothetical protein
MADAANTAQAGAEGSVHQQAVKASAELNKLARALQQVGADQATIHEIDDAANTCNDIASAVLGNTAPPASPGSDPSLSPQGDALGSAIQNFHNSAVAGAGQGA